MLERALVVKVVDYCIDWTTSLCLDTVQMNTIGAKPMAL